MCFFKNDRFDSSEGRDECIRKRKSKGREISPATKYFAALRHAQGAY
jgi:hypothetical protein